VVGEEGLRSIRVVKRGLRDVCCEYVWEKEEGGNGRRKAFEYYVSVF
jgi:hypothetical protein